jgi:formylglycine-generating enzyme
LNALLGVYEYFPQRHYHKEQGHFRRFRQACCSSVPCRGFLREPVEQAERNTMSVLLLNRTSCRACVLSAVLAATLPGCSDQTTAGGAPVAVAIVVDTALPTGVEFAENSIGMRLVRLPAGEFLMGAADDDTTARPDEKPQHLVRIEEPFEIGMYEVTIGQFRKFVEATRFKTLAEEDGGGYAYDDATQRLSLSHDGYWKYTGFEQTDDHPVVNICWHDAVAFCKWLSEVERQTYRLPTEVEWEYACRAGTTTPWSTGSNFDSLQGSGNICDTNLRAKYPFAKWTVEWSDGYAFTAPVGSFRPNAFGLYDMHGNVFEWCSDAWLQQDYSGKRIHDPDEKLEKGSRIVRGGSFLSLTTFTRSTDRVGLVDTMRNCIVGFRVVREIKPDMTTIDEPKP